MIHLYLINIYLIFAKATDIRCPYPGIKKDTNLNDENVVTVRVRLFCCVMNETNTYLVVTRVR